MRLRAWLRVVLLGSSACAYIPETLRVEAGGNTLEFRKKPAVPSPATPRPDPAAPEAPAPDAAPGDAGLR